jgi:hemoglobin
MTTPPLPPAPPAPPTPFDLIGGRAVVERLAARFYQVMERDEPALAAVHRQVPDDSGRSVIDPEVKRRFSLFLIGWLGGPQEYMEQHGHPRLRMRHGRVPVDVNMRDAWVRSMTRAMDDCGVRGAVRGYLDQRFAEVADFLRNVES